MKETVIELVDFNVLMSLMNFFIDNYKGKQIYGKDILIVQSYSDKHIEYAVPSMSVELLHRKNKSIGFNNFLYESFDENNIFEFEGTLLEYRVQLNVYSNTRGEIHKWCSLLDDILKNGEDGIPLNTYFDNGSIKQYNIGSLDYDYSIDIKNNNLEPNIVSYDFHSIYEIKITALQKYKITYDYAEIESIIGIIK